MRQFVDVSAGTLDVEFLANGDGAAVCLVHPYSSMAATAGAVADLTGHPVVAVDPRGVGRSSPLRPEDCRFERVVDDLEAVRAGLHLTPWVLWGMSGGSMVAQLYAHRRPEGLSAVIFDSAGACFRDTAADPAFIGNPRHVSWRGLGLTAAGTDEEPVAWQAIDGIWVWQSAAGQAVVVSPTEPDEAMRQMMPAVWAHDARDWLAHIRIPALVVAGTQDEAAPLAHVQALQAQLLAAELVVVEGAGHVPIGTHAGALAKPVRRFLDRA